MSIKDGKEFNLKDDKRRVIIRALSIILLFICISASAEVSIDTNCNSYVTQNDLIRFSSPEQMKKNYESAKKDKEKLVAKGYPLIPYYQKVDQYPLTGNAEIDKYNPVMDAGRIYNWENIKKNYSAEISAVNQATTSPSYKNEFYNSKGHFRSMHQCAGGQTNCLGFRAYCSEEVAKKSIQDQMGYHMRVNQRCQTYQENDPAKIDAYIKTCSGVMGNLNEVQRQSKEIEKIAKTKNKESAMFFDEVNREYDQFRDDWENLKKAMLESKKNYDEDKQKEKDVKQAQQQIGEVERHISACLNFTNYSARVQGYEEKQAYVCDPTWNDGPIEQSTGKEMLEMANTMDKVADEVGHEMAMEAADLAYKQSLLTKMMVDYPSSPKVKCDSRPIQDEISGRTGPCHSEKTQKMIAEVRAEFEQFKPKFKTYSAEVRGKSLNSEFKPLLKELESLCSRKKNLVKNLFPGSNPYSKTAEKNDRTAPEFYQAPLPGSNNDKLYQIEKAAIETSIREQMAKILKSDLGHLMMTNHFREQIGFVNFQTGECSLQNEAADILDQEDIKVASEGFHDLVNKDFEDVEQYRRTLSQFGDSFVNEAERNNFIKNLIQTKPNIIKLMLKNNPRSDFVKALCSYLNSIQDQEEKNRQIQAIITEYQGIAAIIAATSSIATMGVSSGILGGILMGIEASAEAVGLGLLATNGILNANDYIYAGKLQSQLMQSYATGSIEFENAFNQILTLEQKQDVTGHKLMSLPADLLLSSLSLGKAIKKVNGFQLANSISSNSLKLGVNPENQVLLNGQKGFKSFSSMIANGSGILDGLETGTAVVLGNIVEGLGENNAKVLAKILNKFEGPRQINAFIGELVLNQTEILTMGKLNPEKIFKIADKTAKIVDKSYKIQKNSKKIQDKED